jgi:hypothetical protein
MRRTMAGLSLAIVLGACDAPASRVPSGPPPPPAPDSSQVRAISQLRARLGAEPVVSNLRQGTNDGKAVLCGEAATAGARPAPFVMRGGYLVLPQDSSPDQFATLQAMCTEAAPSP